MLSLILKLRGVNYLSLRVLFRALLAIGIILLLVTTQNTFETKHHVVTSSVQILHKYWVLGKYVFFHGTNQSSSSSSIQEMGLPWRRGLVDPGPPYMCLSTPGRMGNFMFVYATSLGVAMATNRTLVVKPEYPLLSYFQLRALIDHNSTRCPEGRVTVVRESACCIYYPELLLPKPEAPALSLESFLQSWRYFRDAEEEVRRQFTPHGITAQRAAATIADILQEYQSPLGRPILVGVHVRHFDITKFKFFTDLGFQAPPDDYYQRGMSWYLRSYKNVVFVISSDDVEYVRDVILPICSGLVNDSNVVSSSRQLTQDLTSNAKDGGLTPNMPTRGLVNATSRGLRCRLVISDTPAIDMMVLASCNHSLISVGTFGWWSAWLANGHVIYYKYPARENSKLASKFNYPDYYPPHWMALE